MLFGLRRGNKKKTKSHTKKSGKKAFGGYSINFLGRKETLEDVFGRISVTPSEMTKKLWKFIKAKRLPSR